MTRNVNNLVLDFNEYQYKYINIFNTLNKDLLEAGINWYAHSGTLLGLVRENGIIPWDDDIDMALNYKIFVKNYKKIKSIAKKNNFKLYTPWKFFSKNNLSNAVFIYKDCWNVLIDDKYYEYFPRIDIMITVGKPRLASKKILGSIPGFLEKLSTIKKPVKRSILVGLFSPLKIWLKMYLKLIFIFSKKSGDSQIIIGGYFFRGERYEISKLEERKLNNQTILIPSNYLDALKDSFGQNYMTRPESHMQEKGTHIRIFGDVFHK